MLTPLFFACIIVGSAYGSPSANQYFDTVLNYALRNEIKYLNLDPAVLPDFSHVFYDTVKIIGKVKGTAEFSKGKIIGLSKAQRFYECQGPYYKFGSKGVNCTITFNGLDITYEGKLKYGKMPKVNIKGKATISNTAFFVEVSNQGQLTAMVTNFFLQQAGFMKIEFTGLGPLNKYSHFLDDGFKANVDAQMFNSVSQRFQHALNRAVGTVPLPY